MTTFRFQLRRGTSAEWAAADPVLSAGEPGVDLDTGEQRIGDGVSPWSQLPAPQEVMNGKADKADLPFNVKDFGATGDGVADDTAAIRAALDVVKNARVVDSGTNKRPGAKVVIPAGTYMLTSLAEPLEICGNVESQGAVFVVPAAYAGVAVLVGAPESGGYLVNAEMVLPDVIKPVGSALVAGSEGVRVQNLGSSRVKFGKVTLFERAIRFTGDGQGTVYNQFFVGWITECKIALSLRPHVASGWANSNTFIGGSIGQQAGFAGGRRQAGWHAVELDGSAGNFVNANNFVGVSFEGDAPQYWLKVTAAAMNTFVGCRHELGTLGAATTVSGDTLTTTAHGLAVGDMVTFVAGTLPTGMVSTAPYWVVSTPTADTYTVAVAKGAAAVTFGSAGSGVLLHRPPSAWFGGTVSFHNVMRDPCVPIGGLMEFVGTLAAGNVLTSGSRQHAEGYDETDRPVFSARNTFQSGTPSRPGFAAYPPGASPVDDPKGWTTALSDRGVVFAASRAETGRVWNSAGVLQYQRPADSVSYEIPSARRIGGPVAISALSLAATSTTTQTVTLTGASVNDYVVVDVNADLPAGVAIAWARVSAANTVKIGFLNITAAPISLTVNVQCIAFRRYY